MYLNFKKNGKTSISTQKSRIQKLEEKNLDKKFFDGGFFFFHLIIRYRNGARDWENQSWRDRVIKEGLETFE
jgi:hypothetical protein